MRSFLQRLWFNDEAQDVAEYAVVLAMVFLLVAGTLSLIGSHSRHAFSQVLSAMRGDD